MRSLSNGNYVSFNGNELIPNTSYADKNETFMIEYLDWSMNLIFIFTTNMDEWQEMTTDIRDNKYSRMFDNYLSHPESILVG